MNNRYLIEASSLRKTFDAKGGGVFKHFKKSNLKVYAVDDVTFKLEPKEIIGLIGESGCGKTTTAKILLKLLNVDEGELLYKGQDITHLKNRELTEYRKKTQIVFQDPYEFLNPRMNILNIVTEPLLINKLLNSENEKIDKAIEVLESVGLNPAKSFLYRFTHELSGGQRQRVAIARALILQPDLIVADEPTSMLDVSVRAGILNLLLGLKEQYNLSMVFITHDLATAGYMCDRIAVMYKGRIVEIGPKKEIIYHPRHPYTKALVEVAFNLKNFLENKDSFIKDGEVDSYIQNDYCSFEKRCVLMDANCKHDGHHKMQQVGDDHFVACCKCGH
ncbi:MAG TPA: dipeptide/oligopeptide/nickel ABC transporter ATP-binding protein [Clostridiales bacterium]|jgi:oligopeptide/dipeptide ABC transporter ATP-binding protein|nr:dipeptide/oligopeptide/nickel ABC transporter ATP-binding protein [Clostridiales bacterium]